MELRRFRANFVTPWTALDVSVQSLGDWTPVMLSRGFAALPARHIDSVDLDARLHNLQSARSSTILAASCR